MQWGSCFSILWRHWTRVFDGAVLGQRNVGVAAVEGAAQQKEAAGGGGGGRARGTTDGGSGVALARGRRRR